MWLSKSKQYNTVFTYAQLSKNFVCLGKGSSPNSAFFWHGLSMQANLYCRDSVRVLCITQCNQLNMHWIISEVIVLLTQRGVSYFGENIRSKLGTQIFMGQTIPKCIPKKILWTITFLLSKNQGVFMGKGPSRNVSQSVSLVICH